MSTVKFLRIAALVFMGASLSFGACKCPSSSGDGEPPRKVDESPMRRVDMSKRRVLNIRQARKMRPIDKFTALKNRKKAQPSEYQVAPHAQEAPAAEPAIPGSAAPQGSQKAAPAPATKAATP